MPVIFTMTELPAGTRAVEIPAPPAGYDFTTDQVLEFTDEAVIYEIRLALWKQRLHKNDQPIREFYTHIISWLCQMRPRVLSDPRLFKLTS